MAAGDDDLMASITAARAHAAKRETWERTDWSAIPPLLPDLCVDFGSYHCWFRHMVGADDDILYRYLIAIQLPVPANLMRLDGGAYDCIAVIAITAPWRIDDVANLCVSFGFTSAPPHGDPPWNYRQNMCDLPYLQHRSVRVIEIIEAIGPVDRVVSAAPLPSA